MKTDLLKLAETCGCSSKISPLQLQEVLKKLPLSADPNILVDIETHDDAGVYRVNDDLALVLTTDFFPPVCSDPYDFGQIAASNSISDVYAMGGTPVVALNLMMFPSQKLSMEDYSEILRGGSDKAFEAGVSIIGGHSIEDSVPKYGLAVVGFIHPEQIIGNNCAHPGDSLILTKPLGTGILLTGHRLGLTSEAELKSALESMKLLNRTGAEIMKRYKIAGATDITGYGLAGHALKMARASNVTLSMDVSKIPLMDGISRLAEEVCFPSSAYTNLEFIEKDSFFVEEIEFNQKMIIADPQTSGGLLMCVPEEIKREVLDALHLAGLTSAAIIGTVLPRREKFLLLEN
jgi:selenide,water dikinase